MSFSKQSIMQIKNRFSLQKARRKQRNHLPMEWHICKMLIRQNDRKAWGKKWASSFSLQASYLIFLSKRLCKGKRWVQMVLIVHQLIKFKNKAIKMNNKLIVETSWMSLSNSKIWIHQIKLLIWIAKMPIQTITKYQDSFQTT